MRTLPVSRDHPDYPWDYDHRPSDHNGQGLFVDGPEGEHCAIAALIELSRLLRISASSPDAQRKRRIAVNAARLRSNYSVAELQQRYEAEQRRIRERARETPLGRFYAPAKSPNSGRKRRVAA